MSTEESSDFLDSAVEGLILRNASTPMKLEYLLHETLVSPV